MSHTPGPWYWKFENWRGEPTLSPHVLGDMGEDCAPTAICAVVATATSGNIPEANAKLIAAAPDLLEACQAALVDADDRPEEPILHLETIAVLRAAVAKATQQ